MGIFVNPNNQAFQVALNSEIYVDKTGLLEYTNRVLDTKQALICNSRPRRFGKTTTADMLTSYYSRGCDSEALFAGKKISEIELFRKHLNQYDVIHFDVQWCMMDCGSAGDTVSYIVKNVLCELKEEFPEFDFSEVTSLGGTLARIASMTGRKFIIIIDEWDVLIREESASLQVQEDYMNFLRGLFKGSEPAKFLHLAFLTGILPIKKVKTQSALNNFEEFTMLEPDMLSAYIGFTEEEVKALCVRYHRNFEKVKRWYDGYILGDYQVYNPKAVVSVMQRGVFRSYWSKTGTYASILPLISMDFDGLRTAIIQMLSGAAAEIDVNSFQNDMVSFQNKDDVLTLLIHLGYLAYNQERGKAFIPNEEIRQEFLAAVKKRKWNELLEFQRKSEDLQIMYFYRNRNIWESCRHYL